MRWNIPAAAHDMKDQRVFVFDAVDDDIFSRCETAEAGPEIIAWPSDLRMLAEQPATVGDAVYETVRNLDAAAFARDVEPDVIKLGLGFR